ncbi:MAG: Delta(24)-sterol C-methyltransferase [Geoglossum umbratile]|nr:MAG: Delta(24)-sterol C-methyltransferase [Geoglossum umbratile]
MAPVKLEPEDHLRDFAFSKALHGETARGRAGLSAAFNKDFKSQKAAVDEYFKHWDNKGPEVETEQTRAERRAEYATLTRQYYNLVTDLYENAWGQSFHFCCFHKGETFAQAIARHEHYIAHVASVRENMSVLDVGCGVGGPARTIQKFTGAHITGVNNNDYQIERATLYAQREGLGDKLKFVKADFMQMPFPDNTFDAVYAVEATFHAPSLEGIYSEIFRVLKPGGKFAVYEWLMKDNYDKSNPRHKAIRQGIEAGSGISSLVTVSEGLAAFKAVGFEVEKHGDVGEEQWYAPWWYPIAGDFKYMDSWWDFFTILRLTKIGRAAVHTLVGVLEMVGLAPKGVQKTADTMAWTADCLVEGGSEGLITPMYLMVGRKPSAIAA